MPDSEPLAHAGNGDLRFLEGPGPRGTELGRVFRIAWEFVKGFRTLHFVGPCVTVFGSARFKEDHRYYKLGREVGEELSKAGFCVMTGGGPGIMEAANRGAKDVGGHSIGCTIQLPHEQAGNPYLDKSIHFRYFFVRKVMLVKYSYAFVVMPGGFGTMDEIFETITLIQTGKIKEFPIILVGKEFWQPLFDVVKTFVLERTISERDVNLISLTDSPTEAAEIARVVGLRRFGLTYGAQVRKRWWWVE